MLDELQLHAIRKSTELAMDLAYLLLTAALAAVTIGLIFAFERLEGRQ